MTAPGGEDTDGRGSTGMVEEKSREARAGETGTTRFGMENGDDSDGHGTGGMVKKEDAGGRMREPADASTDQGGAAGGSASGLQPGGTLPGGGPGASSGSVGTGGGSNANEDTGSLRRWDGGEREGAKK